MALLSCKLASRCGQIVLGGDNLARRDLSPARMATDAWRHEFLQFCVDCEVLRFGDRTFYKAWWNATDFETYWRTWNMPVHCWIVRHVYFPLLRHVTDNKALTGSLCFTLSAVLHELVSTSSFSPEAVLPVAGLLRPMAALHKNTKWQCTLDCTHYCYHPAVWAAMLDGFYRRLVHYFERDL